MADFTKVFGSSNGLISLDGTLSRSRINPDQFSLNSRPVVLRTKADLVRQSPSSTLIVPSTKSIRKPIAKIPRTNFTNRRTTSPADPLPLVRKITTKPVAIIDRETKQITEIPPINFRKDGEIVLSGRNSTNQITFDKYKLDDIIGIDSVSFQFILRVVTFDGEFYYTSSDFKSKLDDDNLNELPYRIIEALNPSSIVTVDVRSALNSIGNEYATEEKKDGTFVEYNTFVDATGEVDNIKLVEYVDWVVSKPPQEYDDRTIPAETLGRWSVVDGVDSGNGVSVSESSGTATPTRKQIPDSLPINENPVVDLPKPAKKIPQKPQITTPVDDEPVVKPKPIGSGFLDLPVRKPKPNPYRPIQTNPVRRNFTSIVRGAGLVPEASISPPIFNDLVGTQLDNLFIGRIRRPQNIL